MTTRFPAKLWLLACLMAGALLLGAGQAHAADGPPLVETGPADYFPEDQDLVEVTGTVNPLGTQLIECYFKYGATNAYGMRAEAWGESCNSEFTPVSNEPKEVKGKLLNLSPGTIYHYRLIARNDFGVATGADRTVGTTGENTPPKEDPGEESHEPDPAPTSPKPASPSPPASPITPPPSHPTPPCATLAVIGLRGTTEPQRSRQGWGTNGSIFRHVFVTTVRRRSGAPIEQVGLRYPAEPKSLDPRTKATKQYEDSMAKGRAALLDLLAAGPATQCFVLMGYSQGAQVVGDVLSRRLKSITRKRIIAAVLLADPRFDPKDGTVARYGSFDEKHQGFFSPRPRGSMRPSTQSLVLTACNKGDFFCQACGVYDAFCEVNWLLHMRKELAIHGNYRKWAETLARVVARRAVAHLE